MLRKLLPSRPGHGTVVAYLALSVALGGTAYAVNTVGSEDIIDGQVKSIDVGQNEIKSADVKDQSLTTFDVSTLLGIDIVDNSLTGDDVREASLGKVPAAEDSDTLEGKTLAEARSGIDADKLDGSDASDLKVDWALVGANGAIREQSGGITVFKYPETVYGAPGFYRVNFGHSLDGYTLDARLFQTDGWAWTFRCGTQANVEAQCRADAGFPDPDFDDPSQAIVQTRNEATPGRQDDEDFVIMAIP